jgi:two-component system CheB/CheR fusion protein
LFSITPNDEGRPISDFAHRLDYDGLVADARKVLADLTPIRHEIRSRDNRWYDVRLRPYRTVDDKIDGVVLTFVDMTDRRHTEEALRTSERRLRRETHLVELSRDPIFIWDFDGTILEWNRGSEQLYGYTRDEAIGKKKDELLGTVVPGSSFAELRVKLHDEGSWSGELKHRTKDGRELTIESRITVDGQQLALESTRDVTEDMGNATEVVASRTDTPGQEYADSRAGDRASNSALQQIFRRIHRTARWPPRRARRGSFAACGL